MKFKSWQMRQMVLSHFNESLNEILNKYEELIGEYETEVLHLKDQNNDLREALTISEKRIQALKDELEASRRVYAH